MRKFILSVLCIVMALVWCGKSHALVSEYETDKLKVEVVAQNREINTQQNFEILVKFTLKDGWHILANPAGDVGRPTTIELKLPDGFNIEATKWSVHKRFETEGIVQYGWDDVAFFIAEIKPVDLEVNKFDIPIKIEWQACKDECIPEKSEVIKSYDITELNPMPSEQYMEFVKQAQDSFAGDSDKFWLILCFAFVGGLILNFMPCVFPILSLKIISLVRGSNDAKSLKVESLVYMLGVVLSFLSVAGVMAWLRIRGEAVGWGFQLQSPWFVLFVLGIFVFVLLMLLDFVKVPAFFADKISKVSAHQNKISTFITGFFAVLIASPCTAPFMGIAVGYTLTQPLIMYFPVFAAMGIGYALPFTLAGFFPRFLHMMMPKSGRWMMIVKKIFAVPVFFTCLWLGWLLIHQIGVSVTNTNDLEWMEYDEKEIEMLRQEGNPVFINFTAKWCLTCLLNDRVVLSSDEFEQLVKEKNIYLFKADWTNENAEVTQALAQYGRNSIPLYVYYDGESEEAKILPQLLTISIVKEFIQ